MLREGFQGPREPVLQQNASLSKPLVAVGPHSGSLPLSCVGTAAFARSLGVRRTKESTHASLAHRRTHCKKHENRCTYVRSSAQARTSRRSLRRRRRLDVYARAT